MAKPQHFSQSTSLVLQPAEEGVELELGVWVLHGQGKARGEPAGAQQVHSPDVTCWGV